MAHPRKTTYSRQKACLLMTVRLLRADYKSTMTFCLVQTAQVMKIMSITKGSPAIDYMPQTINLLIDNCMPKINCNKVLANSNSSPGDQALETIDSSLDNHVSAIVNVFKTN